MKSQYRRFVVSAGFSLLTVLLTVSAESAPLIGVADERLEPSQLVLHPLVEFEQATLTVEGPAGYVAEQTFGPGEVVSARLTDSDGQTLTDGRYRYSLRLSPRPEGSSGVQEGLFFIDEGAGFSRSERRDRLASIRQRLHQERQARLEALQQAAASSRVEERMTVIEPSSYSLSIDGDFALGGYVFKEGMPFIHNYGGSYFGNTALGIDALLSVTPEALPYHNYYFYGSQNTAVGKAALTYNTIGNGNTATGYLALHSNTTGNYNIAAGFGALNYNTTGNYNTAVGSEALRINTTGVRNVALGSSALRVNTTGSDNTAVGTYALQHTHGSRNVALGHFAGWWADTGNDNIFISNEGASMDNAVIKIGTQGTQTQTYIAGIYPTVLSEAAGYVVTDANGQLGVQLFVSSERYKEGIGDIGEASERLMELRPARFRFKEELAGGEAGVQFGLIAEEVAEVFPELVALDADGRPYAVRYRFLPPLLLNELQKHQKLLAAQEQQLREQQETLQAQQRLLADQRRAFELLLSEQRLELEALANRLVRLEGSGSPTALEARGRPRPNHAPATP